MFFFKPSLKYNRLCKCIKGLLYHVLEFHDGLKVYNGKRLGRVKLGVHWSR